MEATQVTVLNHARLSAGHIFVRSFDLHTVIARKKGNSERKCIVILRDRCILANES